jgi:hypothetical protein
MTDNNGTAQTPPQGKPQLPTPPKTDIWGRELPLPVVNPNQKQDDEKRDKALANSIEKVVSENSEIMSDIVKQFKVYTDSIRASNQNFLLKQGRLMLAEMRKSFLATMADEAAKSGDDAKAGTVNYTLRVVTNNLDRLIKEQEENNKAVQEKMDKANQIASENLQNAQAESKEDAKARKAKEKADQKAEILRKKKEAEEKENFKEGAFIKNIRKFLIGQTAAERREEAKKNPKRSGGILDLDFSIGGLANLLMKITFGAAGLFAVLGTKGVDQLITKLIPSLVEIATVINDKVIDPMMNTLFKTLKDVVILPALKQLGLKDENTPVTDLLFDKSKGQKPKTMPDYNPMEPDGSFNPFDLKHSKKVLSDVWDAATNWYHEMVKKQDIINGAVSQPNPPVILNSNEYAMQQQAENGPRALAAGERKARSLDETPLPYSKPEIDKNPLSKQDMLVAKMAQEDEDKARASRISSAMEIKSAREDALPQSFKDSVNNFFGTVAKKLDDERKKEKKDIAEKKTQIGNAFGSWVSGLESAMQDTFKSFVDSVSNSSKTNDFQMMLNGMDAIGNGNSFNNLLDSMDKYKATTDKMKADTRVKPTQPAPIIVQAPSTVNQSTNVSNGTTINAGVGVGNRRKFLGR